MSSSLFKNQNKLNQKCSLSDLMKLANSIKQNGPEAIFNQMYQTNPEFKTFIDSNQGKSPEQIAKEHNIQI